MRKLSIVLATLILALGPSAPAAAQYPPGDQAEVAVSRVAVTCPETITVSGSGFSPGSRVTISFEGDVVARAMVDAQGEFAAEITVPAAEPGRHTLTVSGEDTRGRAVSRNVTIQCVAESPAGVALTGTNITVWMIIAAALLLTGAAALAAGRRRPRSRGSGTSG